MGKKTIEQFIDVLDLVSAKAFSSVESKFRYIDEKETIPVSNGGYQKSLEFRMEEPYSFGLVAKLGNNTQEKTTAKTPVSIEVSLRVRKNGQWKDFYDAILVPQFEKEARLIISACEPILSTLQFISKDMNVEVIDKTKSPIERWTELQKNRHQMERCKRLYMLTET